MALTIPPRPEGFHVEQPPPGYRKSYVSFAYTRKIIVPRLQLAHTNGASSEGSIESSKAWAERRTNAGSATTCPTFQVDRDGDAAMFLPLNRAQNANYKVNGWSISYETADTGYKADPSISAFTEAQLQMMANGFAYCSVLFNIPLTYPTSWNGSGSASHTEPFGYPYWTNSNGKICPGNKKKAQVRDIILPWAREIVATWTSKPSPPQPSPSPKPESPTPQPPGPTAKGLPQMYAAIMKFGGTPDSGWGGWYSPDGCTTRLPVRSAHHAAQIVAVGAVDASSRQVVTDPEWDGVAHTNDEEALDAYLGEKYEPAG